MKSKVYILVLNLLITGSLGAQVIPDTLVKKADSLAIIQDSTLFKAGDTLSLTIDSSRSLTDTLLQNYPDSLLQQSVDSIIYGDTIIRGDTTGQYVPDDTATGTIVLKVLPDSAILIPEKDEESVSRVDTPRKQELSDPGRGVAPVAAVDNGLTKAEADSQDTIIKEGLNLQQDSLVAGSGVAVTDSTRARFGIRKPESIEPIKNSISFTKVFWALIFFLSGFLFIRFSVKLLDLFAERSTRIRLSLKRFLPVYRVLAWIVVLFIIIKGIINPSWEAVVALGASVGVAIGFAAQDVLKNIFGGITLLIEKPFQVGDKIGMGEHYGEVTRIGFRSTRIVTGDDSVVTIPNAELTSKTISNSNFGENNCQVVAELYLPSNIDTVVVRQIALESAQVSSLVYLKKPISVLFFHEMTKERPYIKMRLKAYVLDIRYEFAFKSEMTEIVLYELYKRGLLKEPAS
ncbi:MAG: mechanosensitive ion channel [Bacteroidia bacterium]|nr:MAG: mechanosensitive ion channel [Bacteroidia bacterium]